MSFLISILPKWSLSVVRLGYFMEFVESITKFLLVRGVPLFAPFCLSLILLPKIWPNSLSSPYSLLPLISMYVKIAFLLLLRSGAKTLIFTWLRLMWTLCSQTYHLTRPLKFVSKSYLAGNTNTKVSAGPSLNLFFNLL